MSKDTRHTYEYGVELDGDTAPARVIRMVGHDKQVLEIGAGPGSITRHLQGEGRCNVTAMEVDEEAIKILTPFCEKIYTVDLNDSSWSEILPAEQKFDVVVAADVLEHLYNPWSTLKSMAGLLNADGYIVISLPHVGHSAIAACLLDEDFDYRDWGLLDRTHIRFFGLKNMQSLFNEAGLSIVDAQFVITAPENSEFSERWNNLSDDVQKCLASNPVGQVYQVVIKAVPQGRAKKEVNLMEMPIVKAPSLAQDEQVATSGLKAFAKKILPPGIRARLRVIANSLGMRV